MLSLLMPVAVCCLVLAIGVGVIPPIANRFDVVMIDHQAVVVLLWLLLE